MLQVFARHPGVIVRVVAIAFCGTFWTVAAVSCSDKLRLAQQDQQEAFNAAPRGNASRLSMMEAR